MTFRIYLLQLSLFVLVTTGLVALVNYLVDPMGVFNRPVVTRFNANKPFMGQTGRYQLVNYKAGRLLEGGYDTVLLGTSRVYRGVDPQDIPLQGNTYNAGFGAASAQGIYLMFKAATSSGDVKSAVIGLDYESFLVPDSPGSPTIHALENVGEPQIDARDVVGIDSLAYSLGTVLLNLIEAPMLNRPDGFRVQRPGNVARYEINIKHYRRQVEIYDSALDHSQQMQWLQRIIALATKKEVDLTLVILPIHASLATLLVACDHYGGFERWRGQLVDVIREAVGSRNEDSHPVVLWDFSQPHDFALEDVPLPGQKGMNWFLDVTHFKPELSRLVFGQVFDSKSNDTIEGVRVGLYGGGELDPTDLSELEHYLTESVGQQYMLRQLEHHTAYARCDFDLQSIAEELRSMSEDEP